MRTLLEEKGILEHGEIGTVFEQEIEIRLNLKMPKSRKLRLISLIRCRIASQDAGLSVACGIFSFQWF